MRVTAEYSEMYVPKWGGNRDLPGNEQIQVKLKRPPASEKESLREVKYGANLDSVSWRFNTARILHAYVESITNLEVEVNGEVQKIGTGKELAATKAPVGGLIQELQWEVTREDRLVEEETKNSE